MIDPASFTSSAWDLSHQAEVSDSSRSAPLQNMRRADAARYIRETYAIPCVPQTLAKYACTGDGPAFRKAGKFPIYSREDLDAWAQQRLGKLVRSTSEISARGA